MSKDCNKRQVPKKQDSRFSIRRVSETRWRAGSCPGLKAARKENCDCPASVCAWENLPRLCLAVGLSVLRQWLA